MLVFYNKCGKIYVRCYMIDKDKELIEDEEDDTCDLDPSKICDNCGKCIEENVNYKIIKITRIEK